MVVFLNVIISLIQVQYADVYMLDDGKEWKQLPPMPKPNSHIEFAWVLVNNSILVVGGTTMKHPITKKMILVGEVFRFDLDTLVRAVVSFLLLENCILHCFSQLI